MPSATVTLRPFRRSAIPVVGERRVTHFGVWDNRRANDKKRYRALNGMDSSTNPV